MKLSEELRQYHESGDFGKALEGLSERAETLEKELECITSGYSVAMREAYKIIEHVGCVSIEYKWREAEAWMKKYFPHPFDNLAPENIEVHVKQDGKWVPEQP